MDKKEIFKIIKENSYMKYCICELIENIKDSREYTNLKSCLENILIPTINKPDHNEIWEKLINNYKKNDKDK